MLGTQQNIHVDIRWRVYIFPAVLGGILLMHNICISSGENLPELVECSTHFPLVHLAFCRFLTDNSFVHVCVHATTTHTPFAIRHNCLELELLTSFV